MSSKLPQQYLRLPPVLFEWLEALRREQGERSRGAVIIGLLRKARQRDLNAARMSSARSKKSAQ